MNSKIVLIDLNGTLHIGNKITPGAVDALKRLKSTDGIRVKFVTNTTKESRRVLHNRLINLGFNIDKDEILSSLWAARELIEQENLKPYYLIDDDAIEDFNGLTDWKESELNSVVIGLAPDKFNRFHLNKAFKILISKSTNRLIAVHEAKYYMTESGSLSLGPGPFVKVLQYATGIQPTVVGKPSSDFFKFAVPTDFDMSQVYMIGDDVNQDIDGAQKLGIKGYLVRTGKYRENDENKIQPVPYKTVNNFADAVNDILKL